MKPTLFCLIIVLLLINPGHVASQTHYVLNIATISKLAFVAFDPQTSQITIYTIDSDGLMLTAIYKGEHANFDCFCDLTWSQDYRLLRFVSYEYPSLLGINDSRSTIIVSADGTDTHTYNSDYTAFKWSPDGKHLAYLYKKGRLDSDTRLEFFIADADGSNPHHFTDREVTDFAWSPDSTQLAISSAGTIYVARVEDATKLTSLTTSDLQLHSLSWSPDSQDIAYVYRAALYLLNVKTHLDHKIFPTIDYFGYSWSPTERKLLVGYSYLIDLNAMKQHALSLPTDYSTETASLKWSPDGLQILYSKAGYKANGPLFTWEINSSQGPVELNTPIYNKYIDGFDIYRYGLTGAVWSPDSSQIAYLWNSQVCIIDDDSSNPHCITEAAQYGSVVGFTWAVTSDLLQP